MITAEQLKFVGQEPVKDGGETFAVTPSTANGVGVGVDGGGGMYPPDETVTWVVATVFPAALVAIRI